MTPTLTPTIALTVLTCGGCGITYALPDQLLAARQKDAKTFWCPNGCRRAYRETETDRLQRELDRVQGQRNNAWTAADAARDQARAAERSARAYRGHLTRTKRRIAAGVCPCCRRTFQDLARHMTGQHPAYTETEN